MRTWHLTTVQSIPFLDDAVAFSWVWVVVPWLLTSCCNDWGNALIPPLALGRVSVPLAPP